MYSSIMMVNPLKKEHLQKLSKSKASLFTLNLEDAIAKERKGEALQNIIAFLQEYPELSSKIIVRINPLNEGGKEEIKALNPYNFLAVRVAKVKSLEEIKEALALLKDDKKLHISLETKEAFYNIRSWRIDERFCMANLGILDLLNSLNLPQSLVQLHNPTIEYILSKFLLDCKSMDINPVSFMFQDYKDLKTFTKWCQKEKRMGFTSKACMGPAQVEIANKIFGINEEEIQKAKEIVNAFEENLQKGISGFMHEKYGFIDEPIYRDALQTLSK